MTTSKMKIKLGPIEIEYEGTETFLKEELPQLLAAVSDLYSKSHAALQPALGKAMEAPSSNTPTKAPLEATTGSLAAKLNVKTGPDLLMAAAARLTFVTSLPTFPRQMLIDEMKTASAYFKANYVGNLTSALNKLVKDGKLNEPSQGNYALTASSLKELEQRIVRS